MTRHRQARQRGRQGQGNYGGFEKSEQTILIFQHSVQLLDKINPDHFSRRLTPVWLDLNSNFQADCITSQTWGDGLYSFRPGGGGGWRWREILITGHSGLENNTRGRLTTPRLVNINTTWSSICGGGGGGGPWPGPARIVSKKNHSICLLGNDHDPGGFWLRPPASLGRQMYKWNVLPDRTETISSAPLSPPWCSHWELKY